MRYPIFIILGLLPVLIYGQSFSVSGSVRDADGKSLPFANVILLQVSDSTQVKGISADETGRFVLSGIKPDIYYLQAAYFGYRSVLVGLDIRRDLEIGAIVLEPDVEWLDEVLLLGNQPVIERKADRLVFNVENTIAGEGNAYDVLRRSPGVIVTGENLEIRGQQATVYFNNRKVQLSQEEISEFLTGLSGNTISAIEVIPNPPASYEAEDGPILNIRTTTNVAPGYKGSIRAQAEQSIFPKYGLGTGHYFKGDKLSFFANYTINPRKEFSRSDIGIRFKDPANTTYADWQTNNDITTRSWAQQATAILDYTPSEKDLFNLTANASYSPNKQIRNEVFTVMRDGAGQLDSTLVNESELDDDLINLSADLSHERRLKKDGAFIKWNAHYTYYDFSRQQAGASDYFDPSGNFLRTFGFSTDARQQIDIYTGQFDFYTPIKNGNFETGVRASAIRSNSAIDYFDVNNSQPPFDIALSDEFEYNEDVGAIYASLYQDWGKWSLKLGLRGEQTEVEARSLALNQINNQNYFELFPSLFLSRKLGEENSFTLDYSRRITRPKYSDLNPFRYFLNENDFDEGNPNLVPAFSHNFNLNLSIKDTYFIDFYYRDNGAYISRITFQDNLNQTLREIKQNVLESTSYGLDLTLATSLTPKWYVYFYNSIFYEDETFLAVESPIEQFTNEVSGYYGNLSNIFTLSKDGSWKADTSLTYLTGFLYGSFQVSEMITLNAGIRKSLWNNRATFSLTAEDLLRRANGTYVSRYSNQDNTHFSRPETQFVRLSFTYNFGNFRLSNADGDIQKSELQRLDNE
ncbi:Outer membrane receptor proteins, mostly Fe transport [Muriicola jejuensis]|uniref:TonB-dependent receptor n=1 Tax=Muriicola jejuensis TaxID=504488 RepID=A0A6P0U9V7_9FLAO|nr:outer membrane beta-barrel family protein [Muriicola jejuensis]NER09964.1 TonB-dependent receptor [Muriicola jejuensis]SMP04351.1 Outer membrane receptor proteins, mostly Fe transport [Muriicola jejuensis]